MLTQKHELVFNLNPKEADALIWGLKHSMPKVPSVTDRRCTTTYGNSGCVQVVIEWTASFPASLAYETNLRSLVTKVTARHSS